MAGSDPFVRGEHVQLRFYQQLGGALKPVYIAAKNWKVSENATEVNDGVNGELRDRLDKVTNFYEITFDIYLPSDLAFLDAYMQAQSALDNVQFPLKQSFAVLIKTPRGNFAYQCQESVVGPWDKTMSSRSDAVMMSMKARCRYYTKLKTF